MTDLDSNTYEIVITHQRSIDALIGLETLIPDDDELKEIVRSLVSGLQVSWGPCVKAVIQSSAG